MEAWLAAHALKPTARVVWPTDAAKEPRETELSVPQESAARRGRSIDSLRKQLHDLVETLSVRDLDKVTAFAEFVKARRAARGFSSREGSHDSPTLESDPVASPAPLSPPASDDSAAVEPTSSPADEEATPSSRKRPAAR
jgi:hypothetical protein